MTAHYKMVHLCRGKKTGRWTTTRRLDTGKTTEIFGIRIFVREDRRTIYLFPKRPDGTRQ